MPAAPTMQAGAFDQLRAGATLFLDDAPSAAASLSDRLRICSGTERLAVEGQQGTQYEDGIYAPREDWRLLSGTELEVLQGRGAWNPCRDLRVFAIPDWLHRFFWDLEPARFADGPEFAVTVDDPLLNAFCTEATEALSALGLPPRKLNFRFQRRSSRSTTFDHELGSFVGLHVDNFERRPIDERHRSFPRMIVNLGHQPRNFVFVNLPLMELLLPAGLAHGAETYRRFSWAYPLAHAFMAAQPHYPALCLTLQPGEGYSAPTQNLIHDGSTRGTEGTDVILSGFLKLPDA